MEARVLFRRLAAREAGFFVSQECGGVALTGGGPVDYRSVIFGLGFLVWVFWFGLSAVRR
jgi:hypothetical protein